MVRKTMVLMISYLKLFITTTMVMMPMEIVTILMMVMSVA